MPTRNPLAARRLMLMAIDAILVFQIANWSLIDVAREVRITTALCIVLSTVLGLCVAGGYRNVLRTQWSAHVYSLAIMAAVNVAEIRALEVLKIFPSQGSFPWRTPAALFAGLLLIRLVLLHAHRSSLRPSRVWVIADSGVLAQQLATRLRNEMSLCRVVHVSGPPSADEVQRVFSKIDAVLSTSASRTWLQPLCQAQGKRLLVLPGPSDALLSCSEVWPVGDRFVVSVPSLEIGNVRGICKRAVDLIGAGALLLLTLPILATLYLLIPRSSPGRAIYRQPRRGLHGVRFDILKFRTMTDDAEGRSGPVVARREDHRITPLGKFLRATRLDELPQLINVLKGEMSLVGPRPERECFARRFDEEISDYRLRTRVKPGLTGLAQVMGSYSTAAEDKLRLDLWYIANQSFLLDLQLLLRTGLVVLHHEQAAGLEEIANVQERTSPRNFVRRAGPAEAFPASESAFVHSK